MQTPAPLRRHLRALLPALLLALAACAGGTGAGGEGDDDGKLDHLPAIDGDGATDFITDLPGDGASGGDGRAFGNDAQAGGLTGAPAADSGAERAISEADIIQVQGDTLYALSEYAGLTVIDIADPTDLKVRGNHRTAARPFEMYLDGDIAYVMFNGYWAPVYDEEAGVTTWNSSARLQALDVGDPAAIEVLGDEEIAGDISDSRRVGDIIYIATYQNGWCWRCDQMPSTRVASFDVGDPQAFARVDELSFPDDAGWGPRSITVNTQRMYVAGPNWEWVDGAEPRSTIQVVDIADAGGALALGAEVPVAGQVQSRWQMDELDGVLRVLSQFGSWANTTAPVLETFTVASSSEVTPLGSLQLTLPRPEDLQAVRFDGDRAYAITFERTDPLFTLDLSDPAAPVQRGELEIPGWVYHMEPRGDRVYGLGFDNGNAEGGMHVSIFDVSDLDNPTMLDRVNFGGEWADAVEDQDRIHKAFNLMLEQGLILVPFAGGDYDPDSCRYSYQSGIQIIDVAGDDLQKRGVAPQIGTARRSLLHRDHLLGISDDAVQAFDISDRDAPAAVDAVEVARNVESLHLMGDRILRFGQDWWTERVLVDFTTPDDADSMTPLGELDLATLELAEEDQCNGHAYWGGQVLVHGEVAYVPRYRYDYGADVGARQELRIYVLDLAGDDPELVGEIEVEPADDDGYFTRLLLTDSALLVGRGDGYRRYDYDDQGNLVSTGDPKYYYDVFELSNPRAPTKTVRFEVPSQMVAQGFGYAPMGCGLDMGWGWWFGGDAGGSIVRGDLIISQHAEPLDDDSGRARYYLDRLDVTDPAAPKLLTQINIPGQVIDYRASDGLVVTLEDSLRATEQRTYDDCYWRGSRAYFEWNGEDPEGESDCRIYDRHLNTLRIEGDLARRMSRLNLDETANSQTVSVTPGRVFVALTERLREDYENPVDAETHVDILGLGSDGRLRQLPSVSLGSRQAGYWYPSMVARGVHAFITQNNEMQVIDTRDVDAPELRTHGMAGYHCSSLQVDQKHAYCAMGKQGVMTLPL